MQNTKAAVSDGKSVSARVGLVEIVLTNIRAGVYRVAVRYGSTGAEVPGLSGSYDSEAFARSVARNAYRTFADGRTVAAHLAGLVNA